VPLKSGCRDEIEVRFTGERASQAADGVFHAAFLPRAVRIAEEGLDAEGFVKLMMLGKLVSIIEADGFAHRRGKLVELADDCPSGADGFPIDRALNHTESGLPLVENQQPLAASGEQHEVGFPMARRLAPLGLGRAFGDRAPLFDEAGDAAASAPVMPSSSFPARQQAMPGILLSRTMIDKR
jgi:hypothetical protein